MDVFGSIICLICLIIIGNSSAIYTRGRGIRFSRRQRSRDVPSNLKAPPTGQQIRLSHDEEEGIGNGRVEVFIRDKFGAICDNDWGIRDADVVCKQIGFLRGATSARKGDTLREGSRYVMASVDCDEHAQNVVECDWETPGECGSRQAAGVECQRNEGCPDGWIAGPRGCYQILPNKVTKREFAVNKCASRGGHLLNIETEEENHFISHAFWNESLGPLLTGGVKVGRKWMWEKFSMESNGRDVETTTKVSIEEFRWFPGWQPGSYLAEPSRKKKDRCLFLSNIFQHPNGSDVNVGYHFWMNDRCSSTRKHMSSGFRYICERAPQWTDVGCFSGTGTEYRGLASFTSKGTPCMKWTEATDINPETYPGKGLGDHNNCRNPDNDEAPWCWISEENFEFCSIPKCTEEHEDIETEETVDSDTETSSDTNTETRDNSDSYTETNDNDHTEIRDSIYSETETRDDTNTETIDDTDTETRDNSDSYTETNDNVHTEIRDSFDSETETIGDANTESIDDVHTETKHDTNTEIRDTRDYVQTETYNDTKTETRDDVHTESNDDTHTEESDDIQTESSDDIRTESSDDIRTELSDGIQTESNDDIRTESSDGIHIESSDDTRAESSDDIQTESSDDIRTESSDGNQTESSDDIRTESNDEIRTESSDGIQTESSDDIQIEESESVHTDTSHDNDGETTENINTESTDDIHSESTENEEATCTADEFRCDDRCIPVHWQCDMEPDCKNAEDEGFYCDYKLSLFKMSEELTVRGHEVETYAGASNETCAKYCLNSKRFVCRSFSFSSRTRECVLSHHNTETGSFKVSRRENVYELRSQLNDCEGMFRCKNGRCVSQDKVCDGEDNCEDFSDEDNCGEDEPVTVKLMGGTDMAGRVEVFYKGEWGLICDDNWDAKDAAVVCNMLGFTGDAEALARSHYGSGVGNILLDEVECSGNETSIDQCKHNGWKKHDCYVWEVAAVKCSANEDLVCDVDKEFTCTGDSKCISLNEVCDGKCQCTDCADDKACDSKVKLVGGAKPSEGRVELFLNGIRGTICDDYFEDTDATVVCRMLGYSGGIALKDSLFGPGNGTIWMDDVKCIGNETDIITCPHFGPRDQDCGHGEDVGVICETADDAITVELEDGSERSGRVILTKNGEKGTICDDSWDDEDATVICRMLGFRDGKALTGEFYGPGDASLQIFLDDVQCRGDEKSIELCSHSDWLVHNCEHKEDAGVHCSPHGSIETTLAPSTTTNIPTQPTTSTVETPDCHNPDIPYTGSKAVTQNGFECQAWDLNTPHEHKHHNDTAFPDGSVKAAKNYCRSPDGDTVPWCYTSHPDERWGYCKVPKCKVDCFTIASEYTGLTSKTTSGHTCQRWALDTPHHHKYNGGDSFPDATVDEAANHCRSPDGDVTPWCYTTNADKRWEYCNVSRCGGGFNFNISCGLRPLEHDRDRRDVSEEEESYGTDYLPYRKLGRIFGGSKASYGMHPWQAGIRKRLSGYLGYHLHHCGGTIIGEYWVLSAAHCFRDSSKGQVVVRTGDLNTGYRDQFEQEFDVEAIIPHDSYDSQHYDNDIALLKLRPIHGRGIVFNDYVQPACLPNVTTEYKPGYKCLISGWGEHEDDTRSEYMKAARVPLVDQRTCNKLYKNTITPNMACAGYLAGGTDTCSGDSGGPLVCKINDKYTIMGVVSFGEGCAVPNAPGVYARVASFVPWIKEKLSLYV